MENNVLVCFRDHMVVMKPIFFFCIFFFGGGGQVRYEILLVDIIPYTF